MSTHYWISTDKPECLNDTKPCPFCGSRDLDYFIIRSTTVHCNSCGLSIDIPSETLEEGISKWNARKIILKKD